MGHGMAVFLGGVVILGAASMGTLWAAETKRKGVLYASWAIGSLPLLRLLFWWCTT